MKPLDQTILVGNPEGRPGNCLQACVASILELSLEEVPHFVENEEVEWQHAMIQWFKEKGYSIFGTDGLYKPTGYCIACGLSERGFRHAVVWKDGELIHDPHPSRAGILETDWFYIIF